MGNELVGVDQEGTCSREAGGGKKALPELKDSVLGVFLAFADDGDLFGSVWATTIGYHFSRGHLDKVGQEALINVCDLISKSRWIPRGPLDLPLFSGRNGNGGLFDFDRT